jgi:hypothetical protein
MAAEASRGSDDACACLLDVVVKATSLAARVAARGCEFRRLDATRARRFTGSTVGFTACTLQLQHSLLQRFRPGAGVRSTLDGGSSRAMAHLDAAAILSFLSRSSSCAPQ